MAVDVNIHAASPSLYVDTGDVLVQSKFMLSVVVQLIVVDMVRRWGWGGKEGQRKFSG